MSTTQPSRRGAVVTGATHGIGLSVSEVLAARGYTVIGAARTSSEAMRRLQRTDPRVRFVAADLTTVAGAEAVMTAVADLQLDVLVNNLGHSTPRPSGFLEVSDAQWEACLSLNFMSAVRLTRAALPGMLTAGRGNVIMIGSDNAHLPDPRVVDYGTAKAALANLTKCLALEYAAFGIRVNAVSPGPVNTRRWSPDDIQRLRTRLPTGRLTEPSEVAATVGYLISDDAANVTGATVTVDGGLLPTV